MQCPDAEDLDDEQIEQLSEKYDPRLADLSRHHDRVAWMVHQLVQLAAAPSTLCSDDFGNFWDVPSIGSKMLKPGRILYRWLPVEAWQENPRFRRLPCCDGTCSPLCRSRGCECAGSTWSLMSA